MPKGSEHLEDVEAGSEKEEEVEEILRKSYLDTEFQCSWIPARYQTVNNEELQKDFEEKQQDLLIRGRKQSELEEKYGFAVENNVALLHMSCNHGMHTRDSEYNALGYNRMGIYLCRHADVCLQHALVKYSGSPCIRLLICKYTVGRHTTAIPRVASAAEFIEPTQGFDSHMSVIQPAKSDSLQNQFDRSQVYLFEINKLLQPSSKPRQVIPVAVVTFTKDGQYHLGLDEPTPADKLASNPRLQQIIQAINAKAEGDRNSPSSPELATNQLTQQSMNSQMSPVVGIGLERTMSPSGIGASGRSVPSPAAHLVGEHGGLKTVIDQINARLDADKSGRMAMQATPVANYPGLPTPPTDGALTGALGSSISVTTPTWLNSLSNGMIGSQPVASGLAPSASPLGMHGSQAMLNPGLLKTGLPSHLHHQSLHPSNNAAAAAAAAAAAGLAAHGHAGLLQSPFALQPGRPRPLSQPELAHYVPTTMTHYIGNGAGGAALHPQHMLPSSLTHASYTALPAAYSSAYNPFSTGYYFPQAGQSAMLQPAIEQPTLVHGIKAPYYPLVSAVPNAHKRPLAATDFQVMTMDKRAKYY